MSKMSELHVEQYGPLAMHAPAPPTLRDQFAMAALTAVIASETQYTEKAARLAYEYADAMLEARKEKK